MKKSFSVIFILLAFIMTIGCFTVTTAKIKEKAFADECIETSSKSAYLMDYNSGTVILAKVLNLDVPSICAA